jgi:hypothetical protein
MRNGKPLVLLLEDRKMWAEDALETFAGKVEVLWARNCIEARDLFDRFGDEFDGMYIDALIKGENGAEDGYTYDFVEFVCSTGYNAPMVTASSEGYMNDSLFGSGCNVRSRKENAAVKLVELLVTTT